MSQRMRVLIKDREKKERETRAWKADAILIHASGRNAMETKATALTT